MSLHGETATQHVHQQTQTVVQIHSIVMALAWAFMTPSLYCRCLGDAIKAHGSSMGHAVRHAMRMLWRYRGTRHGMRHGTPQGCPFMGDRGCTGTALSSSTPMHYNGIGHHAAASRWGRRIMVVAVPWHHRGTCS